MWFSLLLALVSSQVHDFVSETNWICTVCENSVDYISNDYKPLLLRGKPKGPQDELRRMCENSEGEIFSTACDTFIASLGKAMVLTRLEMSANEVCMKIGMCESNMLGQTQWETMPATSQQIVDEVNAAGTTWTAAVSPKFANSTMAELRSHLGTIVDPDHVYTLPEWDGPELLDAPSSFDPREEWPECADVIGHIRDQSACGSCWAFGSTEAYNDRKCIATGVKTLLSVDDTTACCGFLQCSSMGCNGGQPTAAWQWFASRTGGVVTGGDYGDTETCLPYEFPPCAHHVESEKYDPCPSSDYRTPSCSRSCANNDYPNSYSDDKSTAKTAYSLRTVSKIQSNIMQFGSATAAFTVYSDFPNYKSGVYQHTTGSALGGHAIKMVGWGEENGTPYWLIANSWNESWGDNGYFKILRGRNECGIEGQVSAGEA